MSVPRAESSANQAAQASRAPRKAALEALFVTALWSSSWVLIKWGLAGMPPLLFAGTRYALAALLLAATLSKTERAALGASSSRDRGELLGLGAALYFFTQGAQFVSLAYFPAVVPALILNLVPVLVALGSFPILGERPRPLQLGGIVLAALGTGLFFAPKLGAGALALDRRLAIPVVGLAANAVAALLGRAINRKRALSPKSVTVVSMGFGSVLLLVGGALFERIPTPTLGGVAILLWLVVVNTAFAFTLWNKTLRTLSSVESSVINLTMLGQIALLARIVLGEPLSAREVGCLAVVMSGCLLVQLRPRGQPSPRGPAPE